jgi:hypothetical protein
VAEIPKRCGRLIEIDPVVEARTYVRYRFGVPAIFSWEGPSGSRLQGAGTTRDISVVGTYVQTANCPPNYAAIKLEIFLTSSGATGHCVSLATEGRVVRIEHSSDDKTRSGFALATSGFEILVAETK